MTVLTENLINGSGSNTYNFTFSILDTQDVKVQLREFDASRPEFERIVSEIDTSAFNVLNSPNRVFFTPIGSDTIYQLANGDVRTTSTNGYQVVIRIYRETNSDSNNAYFYSGSAIRAEDLNENFEQLLYIAQEAIYDASGAGDNSEAALITARLALNTAIDADAKSDIAIADANAAKVAAEEAKASAEAAESSANDASIDADAAQQAASNAQQAADDAQQAADDASKSASAAASDASEALTKSQQALDTSQQANTTANEANSKSDTANSTASQALSKANQAISTSNQAISTANSAVSTANTAVSIANSAVTTATSLGNQAIDIATSLGNQAIAKAEDAEADADLAIVIATNALTIADGVAQSGEPFGKLYNTSPGADGSKIIDLGDLKFSDSGNSHFPNEDSNVSQYTCSEGTGVYILGFV
jgi:hypothetical protein